MKVPTTISPTAKLIILAIPKIRFSLIAGLLFLLSHQDERGFREPCIGLPSIKPRPRELAVRQSPSAGSQSVPIGSRSIGVSLQPAIPRRVAPSRARFRFTGHRRS
jgi:hypothetical protein